MRILIFVFLISTSLLSNITTNTIKDTFIMGVYDKRDDFLNPAGVAKIENFIHFIKDRYNLEGGVTIGDYNITNEDNIQNTIDNLSGDRIFLIFDTTQNKFFVFTNLAKKEFDGLSLSMIANIAYKGDITRYKAHKFTNDEIDKSILNNIYKIFILCVNLIVDKDANKETIWSYSKINPPDMEKIFNYWKEQYNGFEKAHPLNLKPLIFFFLFFAVALLIYAKNRNTKSKNIKIWGKK